MDKIDVLRAFFLEFTTTSPEEACRKYLSDDYELHEPPGLPHGGVFKGWDAPLRVSAIYNGIWTVDFHTFDFLNIENSDLVMGHIFATWTNRQTGKSMSQPVVELNTVIGDKLTRTDVFYFNPAGVLATMIDDTK